MSDLVNQPTRAPTRKVEFAGSMFEYIWNPDRRHQPRMGHCYDGHPAYLTKQGLVALMVGLIAFLLPFVMLGVTYFTGGCYRISISHYYYSLLGGDLFVGMLAFIGTFLITYRGDHPHENVLATIAGFAALTVALVPATGSGCLASDGFTGRLIAQIAFEGDPPVATIPLRDVFDDHFSLYAWTLSPAIRFVHFSAAAVLFAILFIFCGFVFTRVSPDRDLDENGHLKAGKRKRNYIYRAMAVLILVALAALVTRGGVFLFTDAVRDQWDQLWGTFWFEALGLWAFGVAWFVKGAGLWWHNRPKTQEAAPVPATS